jgi:hypothetical protein
MSSLSQGILGSFARVPYAPTIGTATSTGQTTASVTFTAPINNGGRNIVSYTAVSSPGSITATISQSGSGTINLTGLTAGTNYTFTVYATNALGNSVNSASSNQITTSSGGVTFAAWVAAIGGGGGGGAAHQVGGGGGGGGGVNQDSAFVVCGGCQYCVSVGAGGARGIGRIYPTYVGQHATNGTGSCFCSVSDAQSVIADGGGRGAGRISASPSTSSNQDGGSSTYGGGGGEARLSATVPTSQPLGYIYGTSTYGGRGGGTSGPGYVSAGGTSSGGGGGAGSGAQGGDGVSVWGSTSPGGWNPAVYTCAWRCANNRGGSGGAGRNINDGSNDYGTYGAGGGGSRGGWSPVSRLCIIGGVGGDAGQGCSFISVGNYTPAVGGGGATIYSPSSAGPPYAPTGGNTRYGTPGTTNGTAYSGGGGGGGIHEMGINTPANQPICPNFRYLQYSPSFPNPNDLVSYGLASGLGGSGRVIFAYPSDKPDITYISPTLTWNCYQANGRKFYMFCGGAGTITI